MERAKEMARKAIELDDTLGEAHTSLAWVTFVYDWDWPAARIRFGRAIELNPAYSVARQWHSWFLIAMGRTEAALAEGRIAAELDPASVSIRRSMGWLHYYARQPREALEHLRRALAMNPTAEENHRLLGLAYLQLGMYDESAAAFREAVASSESPALATAGLGLVAAAKRKLTDARGHPRRSLRRGAGALPHAGGVRDAPRRPRRGRRRLSSGSTAHWTTAGAGWPT